MAKLNGWQRLWVVFTVLWTVAVLSVGYGNWPSEAMAAYYGIERQALRDQRVEHVQITLVFLAIPPVFLYVFGWSAGWIRRGFRG